jgi:nicotinate phosphoribosyltransferase
MSPADALFTDLYELTMAASYHALGLVEPATFDLFVRRLPPRRGYLVACGLDPALDYLEGLQFDAPALEYLESLELFDPAFLEFLAELRFTGDVWAMPEGELVFPNEPLLRVTAPLIEAQLVETALLNCVGFQTLVATKAARIATACAERPFVDYSARRDHGVDAALAAARAAFIGGAAGTSLVLAGRDYGIDLSGTMAHSYVMRFDNEADAFLAFARAYPGRAVLLLDTYETEHAAQTVATMAPQFREENIVPRAVRLDSGDLERLSRSVRATLDGAGLTEVQIFASGDLDEWRIAELVEHGAPVDAFGVGTQLGTGGDAPHIDAVYKLVDDANGPKVKLSPEKVTLPGIKQVHRVRDGDRYSHDVLALAGEAGIDGPALLDSVMSGGRRTGTSGSLAAARARCSTGLSALPPHLLALDPGEPAYEVRISPALSNVARVTNEARRPPA